MINEHPGVSHNYLRNHEFNIWFTIATEPDSPLGLEETLTRLGGLAGAESIRQLPTLKLFKIRMDLEMETGHRDARATRSAEAVAPAETERPALRRVRQGGDPRDPGRHAGDPRALRARRRRGWVSPRSSCSRTCEGMVERRLLRRVAAILFHRRAGFSANGMGVWKVPDDRVHGAGDADVAVPRHLALLRAADLCRLALLGVHDGPRALQGGVRRDPRLDRRSRPASASARRSTPRPSSRRSDSCTSRMTTATGNAGTPASSALYGRAQRVIPGGVNSPVRAMRSIGRDPIFIASGSGSRITDVDGNSYIDWVCSWGPLILGHADPQVLAGDHDCGGRRQHLRRADRGRGGARGGDRQRGCRRSRWCG